MIEFMTVAQVLADFLTMFGELVNDTPMLLLTVIELVTEAVNTLMTAGHTQEDAVRIVQFIATGF